MHTHRGGAGAAMHLPPLESWRDCMPWPRGRWSHSVNRTSLTAPVSQLDTQRPTWLYSEPHFVTSVYLSFSFSPVPYGNRACSGGSVETSLMYIIDSGGLDTDKYYPYKEKVCQYNPLYNLNWHANHSILYYSSNISASSLLGILLESAQVRQAFLLLL